jgi:hypothetical protein
MLDTRVEARPGAHLHVVVRDERFDRVRLLRARLHVVFVLDANEPEPCLARSVPRSDPAQGRARVRAQTVLVERPRDERAERRVEPPGLGEKNAVLRSDRRLVLGERRSSELNERFGRALDVGLEQRDEALQGARGPDARRGVDVALLRPEASSAKREQDAYLHGSELSAAESEPIEEVERDRARELAEGRGAGEGESHGER